jgi:tRNA(His) guanylyltransferase
MKDALGDRMKDYYEDRFRYKLLRRAYTIIRVDGKAFHTYTRKLRKPFDPDLMEDMDGAAAYLCKTVQGARFAFVQSDEISLLVTDFDSLTTSAWMDSNLQKIVSISASAVTAEFNRLRLSRPTGYRVNEKTGAVEEFEMNSPTIKPLAMFDARAFQIPCMTEVENYFIWRQQDASKNSISMAAQSLCSHKELQGKNSKEMQELIHQKGKNWNNMPVGFKRGRVIAKVDYEGPGGGTRSKWTSVEPPIFSKDRSFLADLIPDIDEVNENAKPVRS